MSLGPGLRAAPGTLARALGAGRADGTRGMGLTWAPLPPVGVAGFGVRNLRCSVPFPGAFPICGFSRFQSDLFAFQSLLMSFIC